MLGFLGAVAALFGVARDYSIAATTGMIVFSPGLPPMLGDGFFGYALLGGLAQLLMRLVVGGAGRTLLARTSS